MVDLEERRRRKKQSDVAVCRSTGAQCRLVAGIFWNAFHRQRLGDHRTSVGGYCFDHFGLQENLQTGRVASGAVHSLDQLCGVSQLRHLVAELNEELDFMIKTVILLAELFSLL